jgi:hypothetical protein
MSLLALSLLALQGAQPMARETTVNHLLFDLCPRIVAGEVDLSDPRQAEALGFAPRAGTLDWVQADLKGAPERITIAFKRFTGKRACQVRFGGADNRALLGAVIKAGEARGWWASAGAEELGGLVSFLYPPGPAKQTIMFTHWDEYDGLKPATNAAMIVQDAP